MPPYRIPVLPCILAIAMASTVAPAMAAAESTADEPARDSSDDVLVVKADWLAWPNDAEPRTYPGARSIVGPALLQQAPVLHVEDALRTTPGVHVLDETGTGVLPNIGVRGLNPLRSERVQVLMNGYPIAIGPYSNLGLSLFPVTLPAVQSIDVVRGGAAVHYGPNNVGGVIDFRTVPIPRELSQTARQRVLMAEETGNVFSDSYYRAGGYVTDRLGLQMHANIQRGDGYREHSDTRVDNLILESEYWLTPTQRLQSSLQYYAVEAELPGALRPEAFAEDRTQSQRPYDRFDADMWRATLGWEWQPDDATAIEWRTFGHIADRTFFFAQPFDPAATTTSVSDSPREFLVYGMEPRMTRRIGNHTVMVGARYVGERVDFDVYSTSLATGVRSPVRAWDFETQAIAGYVSDTISLAGGRLEITPGVRYEHVRMEFDDAIGGAADTNVADEFLPGLAIGFQATERLFAFVNAQRSLVPVQTAQITREGDVANETAWNYETGARYRLTDELSTTLTLFRIDYRDQILFDAASARFVNLGETLHQGVEVETRWTPVEAVDLSMSYAFLDSEQRSGANAGNEVPNAPQHTIGASGRYTWRAWSATASGTWVDERFSDAANTPVETANGGAGPLPAYLLVNLRLAWTAFAGDWGRTEIGLGATNLLDEEAYFRGADVSPIGRVPIPGRTYVLDAQLDF